MACFKFTVLVLLYCSSKLGFALDFEIQFSGVCVWAMAIAIDHRFFLTTPKMNQIKLVNSSEGPIGQDAANEQLHLFYPGCTALPLTLDRYGETHSLSNWPQVLVHSVKSLYKAMACSSHVQKEPRARTTSKK